MRRTAASEMRWEHFDAERRLVDVPNPEGAVSGGVDLPLSGPMAGILERGQRRNGELRWKSLGLAGG